MNFRVNDPGSVQYGNFINYYNFNSAEERISHFPTHIWDTNNCVEDNKSDNYLVLDVGCNSGNFTQLLYQFLVKHTNKKNVFILGIDIDPVLIKRAEENNLYKENVLYMCLDIMKCDTDFFNKHLLMYDRKQFDVVMCLSITMWIHLNHGDDGLKLFLCIAANLSHILAIEPQPWRCYLTATKRLKKAKEVFFQFENLTIRQNVDNEIHQFLTKTCNLKLCFDTIPSKWNRKISFFKK